MKKSRIKITTRLPQFKGEEVLLIVVGKQSGILYKAYGRYVQELATIRIATPSYSDREGFFATRGRGYNIRSGAVYENQKQEVRKAFAKELRTSLKKISAANNIGAVYMFAPRQTAREFCKALPPKLQRVPISLHYGNLIEQHPFDLLRRIAQKQ